MRRKAKGTRPPRMTIRLRILRTSLRENGYCESFNGKLRHVVLNGESFFTLREAQALIEERPVHEKRSCHTVHLITCAPGNS